MIIKLSAIILQACKFTKNELLQTHFSRILARFKIIIEGASFLSGVHPMGGINFDGGGGGRGGGLKKIVGWGGHLIAPHPVTMANPAYWISLEFLCLKVCLNG